MAQDTLARGCGVGTLWPLCPHLPSSLCLHHCIALARNQAAFIPVPKAAPCPHSQPRGKVHTLCPHSSRAHLPVASSRGKGPRGQLAWCEAILPPTYSMGRRRGPVPSPCPQLLPLLAARSGLRLVEESCFFLGLMLRGACVVCLLSREDVARASKLLLTPLQNLPVQMTLCCGCPSPGAPWSLCCPLSPRLPIPTPSAHSHPTNSY